MPKQSNDLAEINCGLGREEWVNNIVDYIKQAEPPKSIAVNGGWGSGKTSTLIQINNALGGGFNNGIVETGATLKEGNLYIKTVWFEAWKYQNEANIVQALLFEIREQLTAFVKGINTMDNALRATVTGLLQSIDLTFKHSSDFAVYSNDTSLSLKKPFKEIKDSYNRIKENRLSQPLPTFTLQKMLRDAIDQLIKLSVVDKLSNWRNKEEDKITTKLVIIIDDLDRCEPDVAFAIFEAMKLYLNFDNCVFLLGIDQKAIERIIALKYEKEEDQTKATSKLYLEKIVQDIFHIPLLDKDQKLQYFKTLTKELKTLNGTVSQEVLKQLNENDFLPPIPRSIKIYVNTLFAFVEAHKNLEDKEATKIKPEEVSTLIIITYLYAYHYEIYKALYYYEDFLVVFIKFCNNRNEKKSDLDMKELPTCLKGLILPYLSDEDQFNDHFENDVMGEKFPVDKLRQVFWIRPFINKEKNNLTLNRLKKFKF